MKKNQINTETAAPYNAPAAPRPYTDAQQQTINDAMQILLDRAMTTPYLTNSDASRDYVRLLLAHEKIEYFVLVHLSAQHQVIGVQRLCSGTIDGASVYPREVLRAVMEHNSAAVVFAHNHPSGSPEPSQADIALTNKLRAVLDMINVRTLDHIIVSARGRVSFAERGLL